MIKRERAGEDWMKERKKSESSLAGAAREKGNVLRLPRGKKQ